MTLTAAFVLSLLALAVSIAALLITIRKPAPIHEVHTIERCPEIEPGKLILPKIVIADDGNPEEAARRISSDMAALFKEPGTLRPRSGRRSAQAKDAV